MKHDSLLLFNCNVTFVSDFIINTMKQLFKPIVLSVMTLRVYPYKYLLEL